MTAPSDPAERAQLLESVLDSLSDGVVVADAEGRFVLFNARGAEILGMGAVETGKEAWSETYGVFRADGVTPFPSGELPLARALRGESSDGVEAIVRNARLPQGVAISISGRPWRGADGSTRGGVVVFRDVTALKRAEAELRAANETLERRVEERSAELARAQDALVHAAKLEALGRLAGGLAHDFNNLLSVVIGWAEFGAAESAPAGTAAECFGEIRRAGERGAELTRQLLAFGRRQILQPRVVDAGEVLRGMEPLLRGLAGDAVKLRIETAPGPLRTKVDPGRLEQAILSLALRAKERLPSGGALTLTAAALELPDPPGRWVRLEVKDDGEAIDPETLARIFDPFAAPPDPLGGAALGLAAAYGTVRQSGGRLRAESAPGRGATFTVLLPEHDGAAPPSPAPAGTLLLVGTDAAARAARRRALEREGCAVLDAGDGPQALAILQAHGGPIDLLVADAALPGLGGPLLGLRAKSLRPGLRVLCLSGGAIPGGLPEGIDAVLAEPVTPERLGKQVRELLGT